MGKCLQLSTMVRTIQTKNEKKDIKIGPLIKEDTMTGTEWDTKEENIQQEVLWALAPKATHQKTRSKYRTQPDKIKIDKIIKLYYRYNSPKRNI